jgi:1-acyl-sn-glycerol-3-phosphate acyltransferase
MRAFRLAILIFFNMIFLIVGFLIEVSFFVEKNNRLRIKAFIMSLWAKLCCRILGINVSVSGQRGDKAPYFIASNHSSYTDIFVLGSVMPSVFLSKSEVASWPLAGWLAKLGGTVFVNREARFEMPKVLSQIKERLNKGVSVVVFPEGTTNDGVSIKKFKCTFFKIPAETNIPVLPVSISYTGINGKPFDAHNKDNVAWHSDMKFAPHFWNLLTIRNIEAAVHFNPVIKPFSSDRKELCMETYKAVISGLSDVK